MNIFKKIQIHYNDKIVNAILLGIYKREYYSLKKTSFQKPTNEIITEIKKTYLVFIPYKHRMKQLIEIQESDIIPFTNEFPKEWTSMSQYISKRTEEYQESIPVFDFYGYSFILENNSFIIDQVNGDYEKNLTIIYSKLNGLLNEEFDEDII